MNLEWLRPKLAELCGMTLEYDTYPKGQLKYYVKDNITMRYTDWKPDKDVTQAIRCLEAFRPKFLWSIGVAQDPGDWFVCIANDTDPGPENIVYQGTLSQAICLAIAAAMGWKEESAGRA